MVSLTPVRKLLLLKVKFYSPRDITLGQGLAQRAQSWTRKCSHEHLLCASAPECRSGKE